MKKTTRRKTASAKKSARKSTRPARRRTASRRSSATPMRSRRTRGNGGKEWTPAEVKYLRTAYRNTPTMSIADKLNRTLSSVRSKAVALSLKKAAPRKTAPKRKTTRRKTRW